MRSVLSFFDFAVWMLAHAIALLGAFIIFERAALDVFSKNLNIYGPGIAKASNYLTIVSFLLVCMSVYFEKVARQPPTRVTLWFTAPAMLAVGLLILAGQIWNSTIPSQYLDGCSLLGLGGALLRIKGVPDLVRYPAGKPPPRARKPRTAKEPTSQPKPELSAPSTNEVGQPDVTDLQRD